MFHFYVFVFSTIIAITSFIHKMPSPIGISCIIVALVSLVTFVVWNEKHARKEIKRFVTQAENTPLYEADVCLGKFIKILTEPNQMLDEFGYLDVMIEVEGQQFILACKRGPVLETLVEANYHLRLFRSKYILVHAEELEFPYHGYTKCVNSHRN